MNSLADCLHELQTEQIQILEQLTRLQATSVSGAVFARKLETLLADMETGCLRARTMLEEFHPQRNVLNLSAADSIVAETAGSIEVTAEGWLHITLNTLLPNCKRRVSGYIGDTIRRLLQSYTGALPYFEKAFLAIVEYCAYENHNALDNDNKGWKMIPNALKGSVIEDDTQFVLSIGLFSKLSEDMRCEIYVLPPKDGAIFMDKLENIGN